jgi:hypothetical protein
MIPCLIYCIQYEIQSEYMYTLKALNVLDGHPKMEPAGANDWNLKNMGRTLEAWMNVYKMAESKNTGPYFKLSLSLADTAQVV